MGKKPNSKKSLKEACEEIIVEKVNHIRDVKENKKRIEQKNLEDEQMELIYGPDWRNK